MPAIAGRVIWWIALVAVSVPLLLLVLDFPRVAFDLDHDRSSSAAIEYFASRGVHFGVDLVQNVGPLGWVHQSSIYAGYLHTEKVVLSFATRTALAAIMLWATTRFTTPLARVLWLAAILAPIPFGAPDIDFVENFHEGWAYLNAYLAGLVLLSAPGSRGEPVRVLAALALLAFLALEKHTLFAIACVGVAGAMLDRLRLHRNRSALAMGVAFLALVALLWVAAGQPLANLPAFVAGIFRFTSGYNEALAMPGTTSATRLGAAVAVALAVLIALRAATRSQGIGKTLLDSLLLFTVWKHGFVRADPPHVLIFFHTSVMLALLFGMARDATPAAAPARWERTRERVALLGAVAVMLACLVGVARSFEGTSWRVSRATEVWTRNLAWLREPAWRTGELAALLRRNEVHADLPQVRSVVGRERIDYFGHEPGWVLLNHLNYASRPMPIAFAAANESLRRANEAFYRSPARSPAFVLVQLEARSGRPVTLDDGLALGALLENYVPTSSGGALLLMQRRPVEALRTEAVRRVGREVELRIDEALVLDERDGDWVWLEVELRPTLRGRVRSMLLRPAPARISVSIAGREAPVEQGFAPSMAASGFLVSPWIEDPRGLALAYVKGGALLSRVTSVRLVVEPQHRRFFQTSVTVRVLAGEPPRPIAPSAHDPRAPR